MSEELSFRRHRQIFQTMTVRLDEGKFGPPDSYSEAEKELYRKFEAGCLEDRKNGRMVNYSFPDED